MSSTLSYWKIKRELVRAWRKLVEPIDEFFELHLLTMCYDRFLCGNSTITRGSVPLGENVAIYLVYSPKGLSQSHINTLKEMEKSQVSPVLVTNHPISFSDRNLLMPKVSTIIERPNIGYDFGGYRDGILHLASELFKFKRLYLLNDSAWMIDNKENWFDKVESLDYDFVGASSHFTMPHSSVKNFARFAWSYSEEGKAFHYQSYALCFGKKILKDPRFLEYWRKFKMSRVKKRTISRGEIGLSQWVMQNGYTHGATCSTKNIESELRDLSVGDLKRELQSLVIPADTYLPELIANLLTFSDEDDWYRQEIVKAILLTICRVGFIYGAPHFAIKKRGFQFLKKSPVTLSRHGADSMLKILSQLEGPLGKVAFEEAKELYKSKFGNIPIEV
jgi:hypothetical protein